MVFDNCQIDVFFHMRSHYNRLRNVQSVVDCSPPKGLKRSTQSETSFQYVGMANHPTNGCKVKTHNCGYANYCNALRPRRGPRAKSLPSRPGTRRHPEDTPCTPDGCSRSSRITCINSSRVTADKIRGNPYFDGKSNKVIGSGSKNTGHDSSLFDKSPTTKAVHETSTNLNSENTRTRYFLPSKGRGIRTDKEHPHSARTFTTNTFSTGNEYCELQESTKYNTPTSTPRCKDPDMSARDHEYLQFLLRITEDIIKNDLYSNKEMKKVFMSHIDANKDRLSLDRMLLQIHELMKELSMPFASDTDEDPTPSWTEVETAMKGLICMENIKPKQPTSTSKFVESKYKNTPDSDRKCICFDLRTLDQSSTPKSKIQEEELVNLDYDEYSSLNKFKNSLDRLTERTEPISSRATCKTSTANSCSTFGNVAVLPGFECLETPKCSRGVVNPERSSPKSQKQQSTKTKCNGPCVKKKSKPLKRRRKSKPLRIRRPKSAPKSLRHIRYTENVAQANPEAFNRGTNPPTEALTPHSSFPKNITKPIIITLQEFKNSENADEVRIKNSENDYVLMRGPTYLLKAFLDENPNIVMRVELPDVMKATPKSLTSSLTLEDVHETKQSTSNVKPKENSTDLEAEFSTERTEGVIAKVPSNHLSNNHLGLPSEGNTMTPEKYEEIRKIVFQLTSLSFTRTCDDECPTKLTRASRNSRTIQKSAKMTNHFTTEELKQYRLCKESCPNQSICTQYNSALVALPCPNGTENKLMTNDYDLTPQKDDNSKGTKDNMLGLIGDDYKSSNNTNVPVILQDFLTTREIQTEDIHPGTTIVATALVYKDESVNTMEDFTPPDTSSPQPKIAATISEQNGDDYSKEEEMKTDLTVSGYDIPLARSGSDVGLLPTRRSPVGLSENEEKNDDYRLYIRQSAQTNDTSTATIEKTNQYLIESEDELQLRSMAPLLQDYKLRNGDYPESSGEDSNDVRASHHRRVSILKNPIIQVSIDKIVNETDETKKKGGESIIKAVENIKERQANKETYLSKAIMDIESNRESRIMSEKHNSSDISDRSNRVPFPHSLLRAPSRTSRIANTLGRPKLNIADIPKFEDIIYKGSENPSYMELPIRMNTDETNTNSELSGRGSDAASQQNFIPELDDHPELNVSAGQMRQINIITAKLDQFRHAHDKDDNEISATLDKLVDTLKEQQEMEESVDIKDDVVSEQVSIASTNKRTFNCWGLCKKKKANQNRSSYALPQNNSFSEQEYKNKSEAFEAALAGLGQKSPTKGKQTAKRTQNVKESKMYVPSTKFEEREKISASFSLTPIVHSGNRLSLVRIAEDKERSNADLNIDFDAISAMAAPDSSDHDQKRDSNPLNKKSA